MQVKIKLKLIMEDLTAMTMIIIKKINICKTKYKVKNQGRSVKQAKIQQ